MKKVWLVLLTVLCCSLFLAAACGGDDDEDDDGPTAVSQETPEDGETPEEADPTESPDDGEEPSGAGIDACDLASDGDIFPLLGGPSEPPESGFAGEFSECTWVVQGGSVGIDNTVVIQALDGVSEDEFEQHVEANTPEEVGEVVPIDGLGDKAYQQLATFVLSGDSMVVVTVLNGSTIEEQEQQQQDLAEVALGRLP